MYRVEELQFPRKDDTIGELCVAMAVFHVLESFEVKCQNLRELLNSESLCRLLLAAALLTVVLAIHRQCL